MKTPMKTLSPSQIDYIACAAHEANRAWCRLTGDNSQDPYESAPEWQKESARKGVLSVLRGETSPEASHEAWLAEKKAQGWTYGEVKDPDKKTHPCMVSFKELPHEQAYKDTLFALTVLNFVDEMWRIPQ